MHDNSDSTDWHRGTYTTILWNKCVVECVVLICCENRLLDSMGNYFFTLRQLLNLATESLGFCYSKF